MRPLEIAFTLVIESVLTSIQKTSIIYFTVYITTFSSTRLIEYQTPFYSARSR